MFIWGKKKTQILYLKLATHPHSSDHDPWVEVVLIKMKTQHEANAPLNTLVLMKKKKKNSTHFSKLIEKKHI